MSGVKVLERASLERDECTLKNVTLWWSYLLGSDLHHKSRECQWKISHRALYTNMILHEIDPETTVLCNLWKQESEELEHVLIHCRYVVEFWNWIFLNVQFHTALDSKFVYIDNYEDMTKISFLVTILGKITIWEMRTVMSKPGPHLHGCSRPDKTAPSWEIMKSFFKLTLRTTAPAPNNESFVPEVWHFTFSGKDDHMTHVVTLLNAIL